MTSAGLKKACAIPLISTKHYAHASKSPKRALARSPAAEFATIRFAALRPLPGTQIRGASIEIHSAAIPTSSGSLHRSTGFRAACVSSNRRIGA